MVIEIIYDFTRYLVFTPSNIFLKKLKTLFIVIPPSFQNKNNQLHYFNIQTYKYKGFYILYFLKITSIENISE